MANRSALTLLRYVAKIRDGPLYLHARWRAICAMFTR